MARKGKRENDGLRLTDKKHPKMGIVSTILALVSLLLFAAICFWSGTQRGSLGLYAGAVGLLCFAISVAGFVCAWMSLHQENIRTLFPTIGSVVNGLMMVLYLLLYVWGASL